MAKHQMGILGCGDFLRWQKDSILKSTTVSVKSLFDPDHARAEKYAAELGGTAVQSAEDIINDKAIDIVCLFVPPWTREDLVLKCVNAGKHIITTKPLGPSVEACDSMVKAVEGNVKCAVFYRRTGNAAIETYKQIFASGEIGNLALYKQDWIHAYPQWNSWATDPAKNGGPFMDAMIHNLNIARYLMGRTATKCVLFSDNHAQSLKCNDTESMKIDFEGNGSAHLFITWAADLAVFSKDGNDREHVDITWMVTDKGWRLTEAWEKDGFTITASKDGKKKTWVAKDSGVTPFDSFASWVEKGGEIPQGLSSVREAYEDIKILKDAEKHIGKTDVVDVGLNSGTGKAKKQEAVMA